MVDIKKIIGISSILMIGVIYKTIMYKDDDIEEKKFINIHNDLFLFSTLAMILLIVEGD